MKKIAIILAYLKKNLGDDIFVQLLCRRYPDVDFYVAEVPDAGVSLRSLPNLHFSKEMQDFDAQFGEAAVSKKAKRFFEQFDACVAIGGSVFMQNGQKWQNQVQRYRNRLGLSKHLYVIGANFGPFTDANFLAQYTQLFGSTDDICFRDTDSLVFFPGVNSIRYAPDVVLTYGAVPEKEEKKVLISPIDCNWRGRPWNQFLKLKAHIEEYENTLFETCKIFSRMGYEVCLMSFCDPQGDQNAAGRIQEKCVECGVAGVRSYSYDGNIEEAIHELATAKYVIATRFHSMILGWLFKKPTFPIIYDNKQRAVIKDFDFFKNYCYLDKIADVSPQDIVDSLLNYGEFDCEPFAAGAQKQFAGLDKFLMGGKKNG